MKIKDIYAGKPDAGDEIQEKGYCSFVNYFIAPSGVNIEALASTIYGSPFYIIGDKGTGKTALLHYLEHYVHEIDPFACTSFIAIRRDFDAIALNKFDAIGRAISTALRIDNKIASIGEERECDFNYIWRWQLYQKIIEDNEKFNDGLFDPDDNWIDFVSTIKKISSTIEKNSMRIPAEIKIYATANPQLGTFTPGISVSPLDVSNKNFDRAKSYEAFVSIINKADQLFAELKRTDTQYYIFIDELEAYRNDDGLFFRDLRLNRDLMFTVKRLNDVLRDKTKIICSIRQEILQAINRFVNPYQLQKITQGYDERLVWKYTNTNSFSHPIMQIMLKRILEAENQFSGEVKQQKDIIDSWFAKTINTQHVCSFILEKTWHKPRDIVRLLLAAQSTRAKEFSRFDQHTFETFISVYSKQCVDEVREEMRALYNNDEIDSIFRCIQGYKTAFSFTEIQKKKKRLEPDSVLARKPNRVLEDLYRIGIIGNHLEGGPSDQWAHKEQYHLLTDEPWQMIVHPALRSELSIGSRTDKVIASHETLVKENEKYTVIVKSIRPRYILVDIENTALPTTGYISIHYLGNDDIIDGSIGDWINVGDRLNAKAIRYDSVRKNWIMHCV